MKKSFKVTVNQDWCKSCEICVEFCPKDVFEMVGFYSQAVRPQDCIGCRLCEKLCPDFAINVRESEPEQKEVKT
ncbi:MAG: 4Fe-4S binding protein [Candidatus Marinimicrobia bacterium]|nr:4Fe-4S binding protein [Candidatus Neomarinimicrobiota bacterium]